MRRSDKLHIQLVLYSCRAIGFVVRGLVLPLVLQSCCSLACFPLLTAGRWHCWGNQRLLISLHKSAAAFHHHFTCT